MAIRREYIGSGKKFIRYSPEEMADARRICLTFYPEKRVLPL